MDPQNQTVGSGAVSVDIKISGASDLGGYEFTLTWDGAILSFVSVTNGPFLGSTGRTVTCSAPAVTATSVAFGCQTTGPGPGPNGSGALATVQFATVGPGTSALALSGVNVTNTSGGPFTVNTNGGLVTVQVPTATPTATPTPTATVTPTPTSVSVSLGAQADAGVFMNNPNSNFGAVPNMNVDGDLTVPKRSFVSFDLTAIPAGSTVNQAVLTLCFAVNPIAGAQGRVHELLRAQSAWSELTLTWNNQPGVSGLSGPPATITVPATAQCVTFTVTNDVQSSVGGGSNFGWRVSDADETGPNSDTMYGTRESATAAERPRLDVTYTP